MIRAKPLVSGDYEVAPQALPRAEHGSVEVSARFSRRFVVGFWGLIGCVLLSQAGSAQRPGPDTLKRIGLLTGRGSSLANAFKEELQRLGYVDGKSIILETRVVSDNQPRDLATLAAELARMNLELIAVAALAGALEVRKNNPDMPMVIATCPGMVSNGFAASLEHPGGNVTGIEELPPGVTAKRLRLLKIAAPSVSKIGLLSTTPGRGGHETQLADAEQAAAELGVSVKPYRVKSLSDLEPALIALVDDGMNGLLSFQGALAVINRELIVEFANKHRLPAIYQATFFAEAGGLMTWAPDLEEQFRMAARYVDQILRGAKPGGLPIQYPPRYYLTLNADTARSIDLTFPPVLLAQADRILP